MAPARDGSAGVGQRADPLIGRTFAERYRVERRLGQGGMGVVYAARQLSMDRLVALKVLSNDLGASPSARARFEREMRATARIEHPNTVRVYDFGEDADGHLFLTMELLDGRTLQDELRSRGALELGRVFAIGEAIAKALAAAHAEGVVHRDLKPENVMLLDRYGERDEVRVLDFGIARLLDGDTSEAVTRTGSLLGTPLYMSPEAALGAKVDHRADLYALGLVLYQMTCGRVPFTDALPLRVLMMHANEPPPSLAQLAPGRAPAALDTLVMSLLAKSPSERPQTAGDVARALRNIAEGVTMVGVAPDVASRLAGDPGAMAAARARHHDPELAVGTLRDRHDAASTASLGATPPVTVHAGADVTAHTMVPEEAEALELAVTAATHLDLGAGADASRGDDALVTAATLADGTLPALTPSPTTDATLVAAAPAETATQLQANARASASSSPAADASEAAHSDDSATVVAEGQGDSTSTSSSSSSSSSGASRWPRFAGAVVVVVGVLVALLVTRPPPEPPPLESPPSGTGSAATATAANTAAAAPAAAAPSTPAAPDRAALEVGYAKAGLPAPAAPCRSASLAAVQAMTSAVAGLVGSEPQRKAAADVAAAATLAEIDDPEALALRAYALLAAGEGHVEVADAANRALAACRQQPLAQRTLGMVHLQGARWAAAEKALAAAVALAPADPESHYRLGVARLSQRDAAGAAEAFARAVALRPAFDDSQVGLGRAKLALRDADGAIEALAPFAQASPPRGDALFQLAAAYLAKGDEAEANRLFCASAATGYAQARKRCPSAAPADPGGGAGAVR